MSITLEEIRKQAPNGATHYYDYGVYGIFYYKIEGDTILFYLTSSWITSESYNIEDIYILTPLN